MKKTLFTILTLVLTVALGAQVANAIGSLTPSGIAGSDTQYSLNDIYAKLTNFSASPTATSSPFVTPGSVVASFATLSEIYSLLTSEDADLTPGNIKNGTTIFGVTGTANIPPTLTWQNNPGLNLCWDGSQSCSIGSGILDPVGDGSILLGAVEYCQYLDADGTTVQVTPQNVWHLPTIGEYQSITDFSTYSNATQVPGFTQYSNYWSSTEYANYPNSAWYWLTYDGFIYYYGKNNQSNVRCVR